MKTEVPRVRSEAPSPLALSQKCFWFSAALCLFLTSSAFAWRIWEGRRASIEWGNLRITSEQAENFVAGARDRLLVARTRLDDATSSSDIDLAGEVLPDLDEVLKSLGVAKEALERQQVAFGLGIDTYQPVDDNEPIASPANGPTPASNPR